MVNQSEETKDVVFTNVSQLVQDISVLYLNQKFSDVTLILDGQKMCAHKIEIKINNVSTEAFKIILKYIYTGSIVVTPSKINLTLEVMGLAHQYSLKDLEATIMEKNQMILNLQNVCPILNAANLYNLDELRDACHALLDQHASEIVANDHCFNELIQVSLVKLLERDSFFVPETEIFKRVAKWCETNNDVDSLVMKCVRLSQLTVVEIVSIVWPSKLIDNEILLGAIAEVVEVKPKTSKMADKNLATPEKKAEVISGGNNSGSLATLLSGNRESGKYAYHPIGSGDQNGITIKLGVRSFINHIYMMLWDGDDRYYSYYIEVSTDQKKWKKVIDYRHHACRSLQHLYFDPEVAQYIRILGTRNTRHHNQFHLIFFEAHYKSNIPRNVNGITCPTVNVATSEKKAVVVEGSNPNNLFNNPDGQKGYTYHKIGSGSITIQLDARIYKYYIESSINKTDWDMVVDRRNEDCKSWQIIRFAEKPVVFIRITGTHNSIDTNNTYFLLQQFFHCFHFECPASDKE
ncbi:BACK, BTB, and/or F5 F8 type C domain containing protein, partial [Asbolus verrucosus]